MRAGLESTVAFPKSILIFQLEPLAKLVQVITRSSWDALTLLKGTSHAAATAPSQTILRSPSNKSLSNSYNQTCLSTLSHFYSDGTNLTSCCALEICLIARPMADKLANSR